MPLVELILTNRIPQIMVTPRFLCYFTVEDSIGLDGINGISGEYKVVGVEA